MTKTKYVRTIAAMLDHESSNWVIARAMVDEIQPEKGKTNLEASDFDGLSWSAHFVAQQAGNLNAALAAITAVGSKVDGDMKAVTVVDITAHVRALNAGNSSGNGKGKRSRSGKVGKYSVAAVAELVGKVRNRSDFVAPLVKDGKIADLKATTKPASQPASSRGN